VAHACATGDEGNGRRRRRNILPPFIPTHLGLSASHEEVGMALARQEGSVRVAHRRNGAAAFFFSTHARILVNTYHGHLCQLRKRWYRQLRRHGLRVTPPARIFKHKNTTTAARLFFSPRRTPAVAHCALHCYEQTHAIQTPGLLSGTGPPC